MENVRARGLVRYTFFFNRRDEKNKPHSSASNGVARYDSRRVPAAAGPSRLRRALRSFVARGCFRRARSQVLRFRGLPLAVLPRRPARDGEILLIVFRIRRPGRGRRGVVVLPARAAALPRAEREERGDGDEEGERGGGRAPAVVRARGAGEEQVRADRRERVARRDERRGRGGGRGDARARRRARGARARGARGGLRRRKKGGRRVRQRDGVGSVGTGSGRPRRAARAWLSSFSARGGAIRASRSGGRAHPRRVKRARRRDRDARARAPSSRRLEARARTFASAPGASVVRDAAEGRGANPPGDSTESSSFPAVSAALSGAPRARSRTLTRTISLARRDPSSPHAESADWFATRGFFSLAAVAAPALRWRPSPVIIRRAPPARAPTVLGCVIAPGLGARPTPRGRVLRARARLPSPLPTDAREMHAAPAAIPRAGRVAPPVASASGSRASSSSPSSSSPRGSSSSPRAIARRPLHAAPPRSRGGVSPPRPSARRPLTPRPLARRARSPARPLRAAARSSVRAADGDTLGAIAEYAGAALAVVAVAFAAGAASREDGAGGDGENAPTAEDDVPGVVPQTLAGVREADHRGARQPSEQRGEEAEAHPRLARQARRRLRRERRSR